MKSSPPCRTGVIIPCKMKNLKTQKEEGNVMSLISHSQ